MVTSSSPRTASPNSSLNPACNPGAARRLAATPWPAQLILIVSGRAGFSMTPPDLSQLILPARRTNARVTEELIRGLPTRAYRAAIPGFPRRTIGAMAVHLHNSRCTWVRTLGQPHGIAVPQLLVGAEAGKPALVRALRESAAAMEALLKLGCERGGEIPA